MVHGEENKSFSGHFHLPEVSLSLTFAVLCGVFDGKCVTEDHLWYVMMKKKIFRSYSPSGGVTFIYTD